jgi:hypothetical protein
MGLVRSKGHWGLKVDIRGDVDAIVHAWLMRFMAHRSADRRMARLIQKGLTAGGLEDGKHLQSETGRPQGARFSPLAATIYVHYVVDREAPLGRQRLGPGAVRLMRYGDDLVVGCAKRDEAEQVQEALGPRWAKFGLALHPEKTRVSECGRFAQARRRKRGLGKPASFNFLGFTPSWAKSRKGKFQMERRTIAQRFRAQLAEIKAELRERMHRPVPAQGAWLQSVLLGPYRYYGVPLNGRA